MWYAMLVATAATLFGSFFVFGAEPVFSVLFALAVAGLFAFVAAMMDIADVALHNRFNPKDTREVEPEVYGVLGAQVGATIGVCAVSFFYGASDDHSLLFGVAASGVVIVAAMAYWWTEQTLRDHYTKNQ